MKKNNLFNILVQLQTLCFRIQTALSKAVAYETNKCYTQQMLFFVVGSTFKKLIKELLQGFFYCTCF